MSVESLMRQAVTLRKVNGYTHSGVDTVPTYSVTTTSMYLEPMTSTEEDTDGGRNTPSGDWRGFGRLDVDFDAWDQVVVGSLVLDIKGPARLMHNPRIGADSHQELDLREIDQ